MDEQQTTDNHNRVRAAIFMIGKVDSQYNIITGNYIQNPNVSGLKAKLDHINTLTK